MKVGINKEELYPVYCIYTATSPDVDVVADIPQKLLDRELQTLGAWVEVQNELEVYYAEAVSFSIWNDF